MDAGWSCQVLLQEVLTKTRERTRKLRLQSSMYVPAVSLLSTITPRASNQIRPR